MNERKITPIFSFLFISLALSVSIHCHFGETHFTRTCSAPMHDAWLGIIKTNQWEVRWLALNWNLELDDGKGRGRNTAHTTHLIDLIETLWIRLKWKWKPQHFGWVKSGPLRWNWSIWFKRFHDFIDHEWSRIRYSTTIDLLVSEWKKCCGQHSEQQQQQQQVHRLECCSSDFHYLCWMRDLQFKCRHTPHTVRRWRWWWMAMVCLCISRSSITLERRRRRRRWWFATNSWQRPFNCNVNANVCLRTRKNENQTRRTLSCCHH